MKKVTLKKNAPPVMVTLVKLPDGRFKRVSLTGEIKITVPPGASGPGSEDVVPMATQQELVWLFEQGHPYLEEVSEQATDAKANK